jgi:hypothetical protein
LTFLRGGLTGARLQLDGEEGEFLLRLVAGLADLVPNSKITFPSGGCVVRGNVEYGLDGGRAGSSRGFGCIHSSGLKPWIWSNVLGIAAAFAAGAAAVSVLASSQGIGPLSLSASNEVLASLMTEKQSLRSFIEAACVIDESSFDNWV